MLVDAGMLCKTISKRGEMENEEVDEHIQRIVSKMLCQWSGKLIQGG